MKKILILFIPISLFLFLSPNKTLWAQLNSSFDTFLVQSDRVPLKIAETGRNISVIAGNDLQAMSFTSIDDLLQYIPGMEVQSRNAFGAQGDITLRGSTYTQVLVMVDGMRLNDPLTAHFNNYIPVSNTEISRIEILRGAAAAMYGADAVGGVINIITKGFDTAHNRDNKIQGMINFGAHRLVNAQQGFSYKKGNTYIGGGFSMNQSDGQLVAPQDADGEALEPYNNYFDIKTFGLGIAQNWKNGWLFQARTGYDDRDFSARYFYTSSAFDKSVEQTQAWWNQVRLAKTGNNSSTDFNLVYKYNTDQFVFSPDFPSTNNHITQMWNLNINHLRPLSEKFTLQTGLQADTRQIESNDRGNHEDIHFGVYALGVYQPNNKWNVSTSLRLDYDENYDLEFTPQVNVSYVLPKLSFRASVGRSIRAANYTERYVSFNLQNLTPLRNLGNPDLLAESSWSEEIGVDVNLSSNWLVKATAFFRQSDNLVDYVFTNYNDIPNNNNLQVNGDYFFAQNISAVNTNGIELESWFNKRFNKNTSLNWSLGYTYLNTTNEEDVISVYISSHAQHLFTTNLLLRSKKWDWSLNARYKSRNERLASQINARLVPSYTVWNTRLTYKITPELGLTLNVHNLFDEEYSDFLGAPMPRRWLMGGVRVEL